MKSKDGESGVGQLLEVGNRAFEETGCCEKELEVREPGQSPSEGQLMGQANDSHRKHVVERSGGNDRIKGRKSFQEEQVVTIDSVLSASSEVPGKRVSGRAQEATLGVWEYMVLCTALLVGCGRRVGAVD